MTIWLIGILITNLWTLLKYKIEKETIEWELFKGYLGISLLLWPLILSFLIFDLIMEIVLDIQLKKAIKNLKKMAKRHKGTSLGDSLKKILDDYESHNRKR